MIAISIASKRMVGDEDFPLWDRACTYEQSAEITPPLNFIGSFGALPYLNPIEALRPPLPPRRAAY